MDNIRELSLKDIEDALLKATNNGEDLYPKYRGNGIYEISKGVFTGEKGLERFDEVLKESMVKDPRGSISTEE